ncbi:RadC family protein [Stenotrophomonas sp. SrG]|uniref:RadC family protein n=1 Tax=Stenotrophomonas sp. SrG TaxID=3414430 RepID=UPI003CF8F05C
MTIKHWPKEDRPREKLMGRGPGALTDAELLALFLGTGCNGLNALEQAQLLVQAHGPLRRLLDMDVRQLKKLPGLGLARACELVAALELTDRYLLADLERGESMLDATTSMRYFKQRLRGRKQEIFAALFVDTRNRAIAFEELFTGTIDSAVVYPREVARRALLHNAAAVIVGHNHPSGNSTPSQADRQITRQLVEALPLVGVRLVDHIVVGDGAPVSLASLGWLRRDLSFRS